MSLPLAAPIAPLGRRSAAYLVDSLVIGLAYLVLGILFDSIFGPLVAATPDGQALVVVAVNPLRVALELTATLVVDALYFAGCWSRWGATPGQRVLRIRVLLERATGSAGAGPAGAGSAHDAAHDRLSRSRSRPPGDAGPCSQSSRSQRARSRGAAPST
jgi:hypothetical protein